MNTKTLCTLLVAIITALALPACSADLSASVVPIYFAGETGVKFCSGLIVGDGSLVVTSADLAREQVGPKTFLTVKHPVVLVPSTGEAYRAETIKVDIKANIAVLKLPVKGLQAAAIAEDKVISSITFLTLGQVLRDDPVAGPWDSDITAYYRNKTNGKLETQNWQSKKAFVTEAKDNKWLFLSGVEPKDVAIPAGAPITHRDSSVTALYISKFTIEGGTKPIELRMAVPSTSIVSVLQKTGANATELRTPPTPTYKSDGKEQQAFQNASRVLAAVFAGSWERAVSEAKTLVELRNNNANAYLLQGMALIGNGKAEDAVKALDKALEIDPKIPGAHLNRGSAYAVLKKSKEAEADYRKAIEDSPRDPRPIIWLAELLLKDAKRLDESLQLADQAAKLEPDNPAAYIPLAHVLMLKGEYDKAAAELKQALEISPSYGDARGALARVYDKAGKYEEAEKEFRKLVEDHPKNPGALLELAAFLRNREKNDEASSLAKKVLDMNPPADVKAAVEKLLKEIEKPEPAN